MQVPANKGLAFTIFSFAVIAIGSYFAIQYAKGNYHFTDNGFEKETGILAVNSIPKGASVFVDGKLTTATDDTIYLEPNQYQVEVKKDGYFNWHKQLKVEKGLVTQARVRLFPSAPSLTPLTFIGVENLSPSPDGQKLIYFTASNSSQAKNGLWLLELANNPLSLQKGPRQLTNQPTFLDLTRADFIWSPDSDALILVTPKKSYLVEIDKFTDLKTKRPLTTSEFKETLDAWEQEMFLKEKQFLSKFPKEVIQLATQSAYNVYFSPDKKRLLYTASASVSLPDNLVPPLPAASTQVQERNLKPGSIYVYDREEDRNFKVGQETETSRPKKQLLTLDSNLKLSLLETASKSAYRSLQEKNPIQTSKNWRVYHSPLYADTYQWFPDSAHLFKAEKSTIRIKEYDGTNEHNIYSGNLVDQFVYPWPDGSRLIIYTTFSPTSPLNLYAIELE